MAFLIQKPGQHEDSSNASHPPAWLHFLFCAKSTRMAIDAAYKTPTSLEWHFIISKALVNSDCHVFVAEGVANLLY